MPKAPASRPGRPRRAASVACLAVGRTPPGPPTPTHSRQGIALVSSSDPMAIEVPPAGPAFPPTPDNIPPHAGPARPHQQADCSQACADTKGCTSYQASRGHPGAGVGRQRARAGGRPAAHRAPATHAAPRATLSPAHPAASAPIPHSTAATAHTTPHATGPTPPTDRRWPTRANVRGRAGGGGAAAGAGGTTHHASPQVPKPNPPPHPRHSNPQASWARASGARCRRSKSLAAGPSALHATASRPSRSLRRRRRPRLSPPRRPPPPPLNSGGTARSAQYKSASHAKFCTHTHTHTHRHTHTHTHTYTHPQLC